MGLVWNVYVENVNDRKIEVYNIFDHRRFMDDLVDIDKICGKEDGNFPQFKAAVKKELMYYFWGKCEWEVVITSWPPYVDEIEVNRLEKTKQQYIKDYGRFVRTSVDLETSWKIDVYDQVMMNWEAFIRYLWHNRCLIKVHKKI